MTASEGTDLADKVTVYVSTDGGVTWSGELQVSGSNNSKWSYASGSGIASTSYDGNNLAASFAPTEANFVSDGYGTLSVKGLPKATALQIRITLANNANEIWAIDNVALFGRKELSTIWNGSAWSNGLPHAAIKAVFNADYNTVSGNISACKCEVMPGRTLIISSNQHLDIQSDFINNGQVIVENGGSIVQRNDYAANSGNITVKRHTTPMRQFDFTYWSSPVAGQTLYNLSPATLSDKYMEFNTIGNNWQSVSSATVMVSGKGYIVRAPQNFSGTPQVYTDGKFIGPANNGVIQSPVYASGSTWNLLGNPYPSAIDANIFLGYLSNVGNVGGTIYLWTHNTPLSNNYITNDYAIYNLLGGVGTAATSAGVNPTIPSGKIASGQGFFIKAIAGGSASFTNNMRITGNNMEFFRSASPNITETANNAIEKHRIWLNLSSAQGDFKQMMVGYATNATTGPDRDYDGSVLSSGNAVSFYSIAYAEPLAIQGRPLPFNQDDIVALGYSTVISGSYTIAVDGKDGLFDSQPVFLYDKLHNIVHNLTSPYSFVSAAGIFDNRFELRYSDNALVIDEVAVNDTLLIATQHNAIYIRTAGEMIAKVAVFDLLGRAIFDAKAIDGNDFVINTIAAVNQALLIQVTLQNGVVITRKLIY